MVIFNMILQGSLMILPLCLLRPLLLRWSTSRTRAFLWLIPAIRLLLPLPNFPAAQAIPYTTAAALLELSISQAHISWQSTEAARIIPWKPIWLIVSLAAFLWLVLSNLRFSRRTRPDGTYQNLPLRRGPAACLFGLFRPAIILPPDLDERTRDFALRHEYCHFLRRDHLRHALFTLLLCLYWWNPLIWLAAHFHQQDCEAACDHLTASALDPESQKAYLRALLKLSDLPVHLRPSLGGTARHMKRRILNMKSKSPSLLKKLSALALTLPLLLGSAAVALDESSSIGIIGGADGPTSIFVSGREDASVGVIGGADGPTSIFITDPATGDALSISGEMLGLAHYLSGECQLMISTSDEMFAQQINELMETAVQTALESAASELPEEFLLVIFQNDVGELVMAHLFEQDGQSILRLNGTDMVLPEGTCAEFMTLLAEMAAPIE